MDDVEIVVLSTIADSVEGPASERPTLHIACRNGERSVALRLGVPWHVPSEAFVDQARVQLRFDTRPTFDDGWSVSNDGGTAAALDGDRVLTDVWRSNRLWAQTTDANGRTVRARFALPGLHAFRDALAVPPCGWRGT